MKKISYVLLAAASIASCFSCKKDIHMVSEEEFNKAIAFEGVEYLQIEGVAKKKTPSLYDFAPNIYHCNIPDYREYYITKIDDSNYEGVVKWSTFSNSDWEKMDSQEAADLFTTPPEFCEDIKELAMSIGFNKFKYDSETKKYSVMSSSEGHDYYMTLGFENAHLISYDSSIGDTGICNFTYEEKTPVVPKPSQVL